MSTESEATRLRKRYAWFGTACCMFAVGPIVLALGSAVALFWVGLHIALDIAALLFFLRAARYARIEAASRNPNPG